MLYILVSKTSSVPVSLHVGTKIVKICLLSYMSLTITFLCHHLSSQRDSWSFLIEISQIFELSCIVNFSKSLLHIDILNPECDQVCMRDVLRHLKMFLFPKQNFEFFFLRDKVISKSFSSPIVSSAHLRITNLSFLTVVLFSTTWFSPFNKQNVSSNQLNRQIWKWLSYSPKLKQKIQVASLINLRRNLML